MGLGREMDHRLHPFQVAPDQAGVTDIAVHEFVISLDAHQALQVAGIGQLVVVDDRHIGEMAVQVANEIGADETRAAGDQQALGFLA